MATGWIPTLSRREQNRLRKKRVLYRRGLIKKYRGANRR